jgi:hypothetical protein
MYSVTSTNRSPSLPAAKQVARIATVAMAATVYFVMVLIALHVLRTDYDPIALPTSVYAVGPYGFLMSSAFFSMSLASLALLIGLHRGVSGSARSRIGLGLLGVWAVGVLIAMTFPIDLPGAAQTISGTIHRIDGPLAFLCVTVGAILVSWRFQEDKKWRRFYRPAMILSLLMLAAYIATFVSFATASGFLGLAQRIDLAALVTWMLLTAARLRSVCLESVPD